MKIITTLGFIYFAYLGYLFTANIFIIENCHMAAGDAAVKMLKSSGKYGDKKEFNQAVKDLENTGKFCGAVGKALN